MTGEPDEERVQAPPVGGIEHRKAGQRGAFAAVERWREPPHAASAGPSLGQLLFCVLQEPIRGVGDYGMDCTRWGMGKPLKRIALVYLIKRSARCKRNGPWILNRKISHPLVIYTPVEIFSSAEG
jgi:hypothetical protein